MESGMLPHALDIPPTTSALSPLPKGFPPLLHSPPVPASSTLTDTQAQHLPQLFPKSLYSQSQKTHSANLLPLNYDHDINYSQIPLASLFSFHSDGFHSFCYWDLNTGRTISLNSDVRRC